MTTSKIVAITGSIGAGKSMITNWFKNKGCVIIDADFEAAVLRNELSNEIADLFPEAVKDGRVDRRYLALNVLPDQALREQLEALMHPAIAKRLKALAWAHQERTPDSMIVMEIPLLFESTQDYSWLDATIVVAANEDMRRKRVFKRSGLTAEEFYIRDSRQMPQYEKIARADFVILNNELDFAAGNFKSVYEALFL